eukprot:CAMPEP_0198311494 /NCGR_PEP_ID=MMETSP1450-20131203/3194_1 /TAXON_ID=753684 ORGANISM="Madagascaria erythrocladiodes, Strain CCMP3234" /NCGR_SAMPLE_ID=MMETSP1450 /ASSEMBLY_ACC=CAM_ASM_001115 /LENGTH=125 /DNA_ID=CAMNT_0044014377 /DNA_START=387 /DNA_END=764 /DNA_ORIENTATION=-
MRPAAVPTRKSERAVSRVNYKKLGGMATPHSPGITKRRRGTGRPAADRAVAHERKQEDDQEHSDGDEECQTVARPTGSVSHDDLQSPDEILVPLDEDPLSELSSQELQAMLEALYNPSPFDSLTP